VTQDTAGCQTRGRTAGDAGYRRSLFRLITATAPPEKFIRRRGIDLRTAQLPCRYCIPRLDTHGSDCEASPLAITRRVARKCPPTCPPRRPAKLAAAPAAASYSAASVPETNSPPGLGSADVAGRVSRMTSQYAAPPRATAVAPAPSKG
jgi:hypothetical protein